MTTINKRFSKSVLTFEELVNGKLEQIPETHDKKKLWQAHVTAALELKVGLQMHRMAIAEIAERACMIFKGGDVKSKDFGAKRRDLTVKRFAKEIGINGRTLGTWILAKNRVFEHLPEHLKSEFNITAADVASRKLVKMKNPTKKDAVEEYQRALEPEKHDLYRRRFTQDIGRVRAKLSKLEYIKALSDEEREKLRLMAKEALAQLNSFEKIQRIPKRRAA